MPIANQTRWKVGRQIEFRTYGVTGGGMRIAKVDLSSGAVRFPASPGEQPGRSLRANSSFEATPDIGRDRFLVAGRHLRMPSPTMIPILATAVDVSTIPMARV